VGLIVVGVDGSESSIEALRWAVAQARLTNASLEVLSTWELPTSFGWSPPWPADFNPEKQTKTALAEIVDHELGTQSGLEVRQSVVEGNAALALVHAAKHAELLVVGSRGHGAFTGMLLGSVSEYCAAHAHCPVVVVRHMAATDEP
jgi:nucleotide-binding universal stress UspA family protein